MWDAQADRNDERTRCVRPALGLRGSEGFHIGDSRGNHEGHEIGAFNRCWCPESRGGESCGRRATPIEDQPLTVTREDALAAYATDPVDIFQDCGDFVVLAAFTTERRR